MLRINDSAVSSPPMMALFFTTFYLFPTGFIASVVSVGHIGMHERRHIWNRISWGFTINPHKPLNVYSSPNISPSSQMPNRHLDQQHLNPLFFNYKFWDISQVLFKPGCVEMPVGFTVYFLLLSNSNNFGIMSPLNSHRLLLLNLAALQLQHQLKASSFNTSSIWMSVVILCDFA
jgi:hypothetical protein